MWDGRESFFNPLGDEQTFAANLNADLAATNKFPGPKVGWVT